MKAPLLVTIGIEKIVEIGRHPRQLTIILGRNPAHNYQLLIGRNGKNIITSPTDTNTLKLAIDYTEDVLLEVYSKFPKNEKLYGRDSGRQLTTTDIKEIINMLEKNQYITTRKLLS